MAAKYLNTPPIIQLTHWSSSNTQPPLIVAWFGFIFNIKT